DKQKGGIEETSGPAKQKRNNGRSSGTGSASDGGNSCVGATSSHAASTHQAAVHKAAGRAQAASQSIQ
ncbi:unnamed protein product, partial [Linum tenue]